jgi:hypothetical protein
MAASSACREEVNDGRRARLAGFSMLLVLPMLCGCGIYVTGDALNPPFGISMSEVSLQFAGYNTESVGTGSTITFAGYTIWFKETADGGYGVAGYKGELAKPTIPWLPGGGPPPGLENWVQYEDLTVSDPGNPRFVITVQVADLFHPDYGKSFSDLNTNNPGHPTFFFAVSATDTESLDGELVEFGEWPP